MQSIPTPNLKNSNTALYDQDDDDKTVITDNRTTTHNVSNACIHDEDWAMLDSGTTNHFLSLTGPPSTMYDQRKIRLPLLFQMETGPNPLTSVT